MYIHREKKLIYLAHPRTASQATRDALKPIGFLAHDAHHGGISPYVKGRRDQYSIATTVRNHFDALVSWWQATNRPIPLGPEYVELLFREQAPGYLPHPNRLWELHCSVADTIFQFECVAHDLNTWLNEHGLRSVKVQRTNVTKQKHGAPYTSFVPRSFVPYVRDRFGEEMERFGYDYNIPRVV